MYATYMMALSRTTGSIDCPMSLFGDFVIVYSTFPASFLAFANYTARYVLNAPHSVTESLALINIWLPAAPHSAPLSMNSLASSSYRPYPTFSEMLITLVLNEVGLYFAFFSTHERRTSHTMLPSPQLPTRENIALMDDDSPFPISLDSGDDFVYPFYCGYPWV